MTSLGRKSKKVERHVYVELMHFPAQQKQYNIVKQLCVCVWVCVWVCGCVWECVSVSEYECECVWVWEYGCEYESMCVSVCMCECVCVSVCVSLSNLTLCDPLDCSLPGSSVHGILQARILEWVAMPSSRGSSQPRNQTGLPHCRWILYHQSQSNHTPIIKENVWYFSWKF